MELKRKISDQLAEWKGKYSDKHALLVEGARRIGKSTACKRFAEENYKSYIIIDFAKANKKIKNSYLHVRDKKTNPVGPLI